MYYNEIELITMMERLEDFTYIPEDYHIIGIRSSEDNPNKMDDVFNLFKHKKLILSTSGTTNPGTPILKGGFLKFNKDGAAILESDRIYYNVWKYGLHRGKIPALRQRGAEVTVWRDGDMDGKSEEKGKRTTGWYGINFHSDQYDIYARDKDSDKINNWSAGCQVCDIMKDYIKIIELTKSQETVTYTLLNEFSV